MPQSGTRLLNALDIAEKDFDPTEAYLSRDPASEVLSVGLITQDEHMNGGKLRYICVLQNAVYLLSPSLPLTIRIWRRRQQGPVATPISTRRFRRIC